MSPGNFPGKGRTQPRKSVPDDDIFHGKAMQAKGEGGEEGTPGRGGLPVDKCPAFIGRERNYILRAVPPVRIGITRNEIEKKFLYKHIRAHSGALTVFAL